MLKRKPLRKPGFDYSKAGIYFVTICVNDYHALLWENVGADIIRPLQTVRENSHELSHYGKIVDSAIQNISSHYENVTVDEYCVMPDHVHILLRISDSELDGRLVAAPTLSTVIGQLKRYISKTAQRSFFQRSFSDRIVRDESEYRYLKQYILDNPDNWLYDEPPIFGERE